MGQDQAMTLARLSLVPLVLLTLGTVTFGRTQDHDHGPAVGEEHLGRAHFETSCSPAAQVQFDRALAMLHSFFFPETVKTFTAIPELDPSCAIAYWGIAISQRPNPLVGPFDDATLKRGLDAVDKGLAIGPKTPREREWLTALREFFRDYALVDQETRTRNYTRAMEALAARYPKDIEATIFYALALNESYDHGDKSYAPLLKAVRLLEPIERRHPDHPGVKHYIIHSYDFPPLAKLGLPAANKYAELAPTVPHALHMPSHIYSMLGMWDASITANLRTVSAGKAYAAAAHLDGVYPSDLHSYDFMQYAYLQLGLDEKARAIVSEVEAITKVYSPRLSSETGQSAVPARICLERQDWACAAALPPLGLSPAAEAVTYFARALGRARGSQPGTAQADIDALGALKRTLESTKQSYWAGQVEIQMLAARAWVAESDHRADEALSLMRAAADGEDMSEKHVAMENRLYPMRELLADMLLSRGDAAGALSQYEASLKAAPGRLRGLYGAGRAAQVAGNRRKALDYYRTLVRMTAGADGERPELREAREYVAQK
jgi:hypothetical protein